MRELGIYVHVPFCVRRCPYCGFYSNACGRDGSEERIKEYFGLLKKELGVRAGEAGDACSSRYFVDSIYFGGGTPSLVNPGLIGGFIEEIKAYYQVSDNVEINMEANPGALGENSMGASAGAFTYQKLAGFREAGVNRLSIGLQSFDDSVLHTLGRIHSTEDFIRSFDAAREAGFDNINVDLMFGVPGQSREIWTSTLDRIMQLKPEHVSFYSLQIEEGTRFYDQYKMGNMVPVSDEDDRGMYHDAIQCLRENGYHWYEISNAAIPGRECRHNLKYWTFKDYLGIGASASSFLGGVRKTNPSDGYQEYADAGFDECVLAENHRNSTFDNAADYMITGLRLTEGVNEADFERKFGEPIWEMFPDAKVELQSFFDVGLIEEKAGRLYITEKGMDVSNKIMECFV